jgi:hypothetical protein
MWPKRSNTAECSKNQPEPLASATDPAIAHATNGATLDPARLQKDRSAGIRSSRPRSWSILNI